jgi:hypothetical protein
VASVKDRVARIAEDLVNLEINTIVDDRANIIGKKMPSARHALIDIGQDYYITLGRLGAKLDGMDSERPGSFNAFDAFRNSAKARFLELEAKRGDPGSAVAAESDMYMLLRIQDMSDQLKGVVFEDLKLRKKPEAHWENRLSREEIVRDKIPPLDLGVDQLALIRKVWEIGVQEIAVQTVVQIDGDVVTRIQSKYATEGGAALLKIHHDGVKTSVDFWKDLIRIAKDLLTTLFGLISRG